MASVERRTQGRKTRWVVRFRDGAGASRSRSFEGERHARHWLALLEAEGYAAALAALDEKPQDPHTLKSWLEAYVATRRITGGTKTNYATFIRHLSPSLAALPLGDVKTTDLQRWSDSLIRDFNEDSAARHMKLVASALRFAVQEGLLEKDPSLGVRRGQEGRRRIAMALSRKEVERLIELTPKEHRLYVRTLASTGMRPGEVHALRVRHFNAERRTLFVEEAFKVEEHGRRELGAPKTPKSRRTLGLGVALARDLQAHVARKGQGEHIFVTVTGNPMSQGSFWKVWKKVQDAFEAETGKRPRLYDLRHSWVTAGLQEHPLHVVSQLAGHSRLATTVETYSHLLSGDAAKVAETTSF